MGCTCVTSKTLEPFLHFQSDRKWYQHFIYKKKNLIFWFDIWNMLLCHTITFCFKIGQESYFPVKRNSLRKDIHVYLYVSLENKQTKYLTCCVRYLLLMPTSPYTALLTEAWSSEKIRKNQQRNWVQLYTTNSIFSCKIIRVY